MTKLEQAARQALDFIDYFVFNGDNAAKAKSISTALREALAEQAEQEPVAWMNEERNTITWNELYPNMTPLYAAPVRTKDLTDDEIMRTLFSTAKEEGKNMGLLYARAVIAAYREKNK